MTTTPEAMHGVKLKIEKQGRSVTSADQTEPGAVRTSAATPYNIVREEGSSTLRLPIDSRWWIFIDQAWD